MKMLKYYRVIFHYIKDATISMVSIIHAYSKEEAEIGVIYNASKVLEIHEGRLCVDSITELREDKNG